MIQHIVNFYTCFTYIWNEFGLWLLGTALYASQLVVVVSKPCRTFANPWTSRLLCPWDFSRQEDWSDCHFFLQGIFPTQGSHQSLLHCRWNFTTEPPGKPIRVNSVQQLSCVQLFVTLDCSTPCFPLHHQLLELGQTHVHWVSDAIQPFSSSVSPFSSFLQSSPASGTFAVSQFFASGGQSIGASASASASVFPMNIQDWSPLGLTGLISLQSKGLSRVFSSTTVQKHQFFGNQLSLWSNSHIHTWLLEKP